MRQEIAHVAGNHNEPKDRRADDSWRSLVTERIDSLEKQIAANTTITEAIKSNTDEIVEFFQAGKGFFVVVRSVGALAKWIAYIAAAAGLAWGIAKFGIAQVIADLKK